MSKAILKSLQGVRDTKSPYPWRKHEASAYLGISMSALDRNLQSIPHVKIGDSKYAPVRFSPEELEQWLASQHRGGTK